MGQVAWGDPASPDLGPQISRSAPHRGAPALGGTPLEQQPAETRVRTRHVTRCRDSKFWETCAVPQRQVGVGLLGAAAGVGLVHAAFTVYWAAGGRWLLRTVGAWAVRLADSSPLACAVVLGAVAVLKCVGALVPIAVET